MIIVEGEIDGAAAEVFENNGRFLILKDDAR